MKKSNGEMLNVVKEICTYYSDDFIILNDIRKLATCDIPLNVLVDDTNLILYCAAGKLKLDVNNVSYELCERQILICPSKAELTNYLISEDCYCHGLSLSSNTLHGALKNNISLWNKCIYVDKVNTLTLNEDGEDLWIKYYDLLAAKILSEEINSYDSFIIQSIIYALVLELCGRMLLNASELLKCRMTEHTKQSSFIFRNYLDLLNNTPVKYHPVEFYASQLYVTPKYLANVCRQESGKSAIAWIHERVIQDIVFLLENQDLSLTEIASRTGFDTVSLFGRFVRTYMGTSPRNLRKKNVTTMDMSSEY